MVTREMTVDWQTSTNAIIIRAITELHVTTRSISIFVGVRKVSLASHVPLVSQNAKDLHNHW